MKNNLRLILLPFIISVCSCTSNKGQKNHKFTNDLINENSPYLLQHAHNPVNWKPWGDKALNDAKKENKLLIISIGYAACHWCHVMEHESFEDTLVANKMNAGYVPIKVDREERPDVDQVYMDAAQLLTGRGGWPLNVIALPDGRPIYAGTYYPKEEWIKIIDFFTNLYQTEPAKLIEQAERLTAGIQQVEMPEFNSKKSTYDDKVSKEIFDLSTQNFDLKYGGKKGAPKFPMPTIFEYLLIYNYFENNSKATNILKSTLNNMAFGGIYDQLGGGFARYSTDQTWTVPHFEKMLYDNSQLVSLYSHAYQYFQDSEYARIIRETLEFTERELSDESGGYYSSLDADSDGEEGKFYVWTVEQIDKLLGEDAKLFKKFYGVSKYGNFEKKNILIKKMSLSQLAQMYNLSIETVENSIHRSKKILLKERAKRIRPGLDDKILTSWNALMIIGYVDAYFALGDANYLDRALKNGKFLLNNQIQKSGNILRNYKKGKSSINGFLDDYSHTILAFIKLYEATFDELWLYKANELKEYVVKHFTDDTSQMFYYTSDKDTQLIVRKMELTDNVIPSSNSTMAHALFLLGQYFFNKEDLERAKQMVANSEKNMKKYPDFYSNWVKLYNLMGKRHYEIAIVGKNANQLKTRLANKFIPNKILLGGKDEGNLELLKGKYSKGNTFIYVCENKTCLFPVQDVTKALEQIKK